MSFALLTNLFGPVSYILAIGCIFLGMIVIERMITYFSMPKLKAKRINQLINLIELKEYTKAKDTTNNDKGLIKRLILPIFGSSKDLAEQEVSLYLLKLRHKLQQPLNWLNLVAIIAPMIGLLGTIWGMSHSFSTLAMNMESNHGMQQLIEYLSQAMWATAFGIFLAVISLCTLYILRYWSEHYLNHCEHELNRLSIAVARSKL
ncbi:MotA/TolQ/ExbB proton channel family protein [Thiotrichales bacterium 19X7-9]|nr:MotA/TolQ/ExbB proton channel family protein [Thiotrichales bacterium 19X7-9]